jgi:hypothetical protein
MTRIFDNIELSLGPHLQSTLEEFQTMDTAVGYFNLRGWRVFADRVSAKAVAAGAEAGPVARVLIGMVTAHPQEETLNELQRQLEGVDREEGLTDNPTALRRKEHLIAQLREQLCRGLPNAVDRATLRALRDQVAEGEVKIKVHTSRALHGKTYVFHKDSPNTPIMGFVGSSNLTAAGLASNLELNVDVVDDAAAHALAKWFQDRWDDPLSLDVGPELLTLLDESWASEIPAAPYDVYLKLCYDLSRDVRDGLAEYSLTGPINDILLDYQKEAVKTLARRIESRGGTMLGDVVGLGKTLTAVAVATLMREEFNYSTLVVCPKNLVSMWKEHLDAYQVHSDVVPYSMAAKTLPNLGKYKFVIVDESHTMRNDERKDYIALREYIREFDCRVLLLTATPYNVGFGDVANQLGLWIDPDDDLGLQPSVALAANPSSFNKLDGKVSTLEAFRLSEEPDDWKRLMSEHLVRRTRTFIKEKAAAAGQIDDRGVYLTFSDGDKFYFPKRVPGPIQHSFTENDAAAIMASDATFTGLDALLLPRYGLGEYLAKGQTYSEEEQKTLDAWKRSKGQVRGFVRTNFYKRLSSCGHSFMLSMQRHIARNNLFLYALNSGLPVPTGTIVDAMFMQTDTDEDFDSEIGSETTVYDQYEALFARKPSSVTWVRPDIFSGELAKALEHDTAILNRLINSFGDWSPSADSKLQALKELVTTRHGKDKLLIFTEYADTANYLKEQLVSAGVKSVEVATGDSDDPTKLAHRFSPHSNAALDDDGRERDFGEPIRVLIATDVLSEGQNLQDSHIVVNYDLPWAIIKLIQRAGRVDRVGQKAPKVLIYSFFHNSLESVLNLRTRIARRLRDNAKAFGADEQFFGTADEVALIKDAYNGDDLADPEDALGVDAASQAFLAWSEAVAHDPSLAQRIPSLPDLLHSTKPGPAPRPFSDGVGCFVRTSRGFDAYGFASANGDVQLVTGQEILSLFKCTAQTPSKPDRDDNDALLASLVRGEGAPLARPQLHEGQLKGIRKRVWKRLTGSLQANDQVNIALDALHQHPLTHEAERVLRKSLATGDIEALADMLVRLFSEDRLITRADGSDPVRIVSSMGISS